MRTIFKAAFALALIAGMTTATAHAQNSDFITARATVLTPLAVVGDADLDFGNVFPGVPATVAVTDPTAGHFTVNGADNAGVDITFALPTDLVFGANLLPIASWTGVHNTTNAAAGGTAFTPSAAVEVSRLSTGASPGELYVFIGATVTPAATQPAGLYTAPVTMTVVYNGT
jgi:hypothetical protein